METNQKTYPSVSLRDSKGNLVDQNYTYGLPSEINMSTEVSDYLMDSTLQPIGFYIIPLVAGVIKVQLLNQSDSEYYIYSAEEVNAYIGKPFDGRIKKIFKTGTTVTRLKIVW